MAEFPVAFLIRGRDLYVWAESVTLQSCLSEVKSSSYTSVKVRGINIHCDFPSSLKNLT